MAAIDKIYLDSYDEYTQFHDWLLKQPKLKDKYGKEVSLMRYFFDWWDDKDSWLDENDNDISHPVYSAPYYVDAYIIRNCPLDFVQIAIRGNYGYAEQDEIDEWYRTVKNRTTEEQKIIDEYNANHKDGDYNTPRDAKGNTIPCWWMSLDDFEIIDGKIIYKKLEKSTYEEILDGELYTTPYRENVKRGTHFKLVKSPYKHRRKGIPFERSIGGPWWVDVEIGKYEFLWFNSNDFTDNNGTWDYTDEFVEKRYSTSSVRINTITAIKRHIRKWNLPIGAKVIVRGAYEAEDYEFVVTK